MEVNDKITLVEKVTNQFRVLDLLMEKVLMLIGAFTFGLYLSYYLFKRNKKKNQKEQIQ